MYAASLGLAVGSAVAFGAAAYLSAIVARRFGAWATNLGEQLGVLLVLLPIAPFVLTGRMPRLLDAAAVFGIGALLMCVNFAAYRLLTIAPLALIWPILASNGAVISLMAIVFLHERVAASQAAGLALVVAGVALASYAPGHDEAVVTPTLFTSEPRAGQPAPLRGSRPTLFAAIFLAVFSGVVFFGLIIYIKTLGWYLPVALERTGQVFTAFALLAAGIPPLQGLAGHRVRGWLLLVLVGLLDGLGLVMYAVGNRIGPTAIVAVVSSAYIVVPVLLGVLIIRERPTRFQLAGIGGVVVGLVLVSA